MLTKRNQVNPQTNPPPSESVQNLKDADSLKFSNTMQWDPALLSAIRQQTKYLQSWQEHIKIDSPYINSSKLTMDELNQLLSYKQIRSTVKIQQIKSEIDIKSAKFGTRVMADYVDPIKFPKTAKALLPALIDTDIIVLNLKQRFDRVRPHILEPRLEPIIEVPGHPAYPSGHSTESHVLAYLLAELLPQCRDVFEARALEIAVNREIVGVHYPSDTLAGIALAKQIIKLLLDEPKFMQLIQEAKSEWVGLKNSC
ncbi:MAG: phosphatase PAP2 family protein [bacterium]|nr:phosphatase PAP2 family protein [bacterium]